MSPGAQVAVVRLGARNGAPSLLFGYRLHLKWGPSHIPQDQWQVTGGSVRGTEGWGWALLVSKEHRQ